MGNANEISIVRAELADLNSLQQISIQTFKETFGADNTSEDMQEYIQDHFSLKQLEEELNHPESEFYLAKKGSRIIAYLKLNFKDIATVQNQGKQMEVERIYLLSEYQGLGWGQHLMLYAIQRGYAKNVNFIWLGVWEKNFRAIRFYTKNGFKVFDEHIFVLGSDQQRDLLMKLQLN